MQRRHWRPEWPRLPSFGLPDFSKPQHNLHRVSVCAASRLVVYPASHQGCGAAAAQSDHHLRTRADFSAVPAILVEPPTLPEHAFYPVYFAINTFWSRVLDSTTSHRRAAAIY